VAALLLAAALLPAQEDRGGAAAATPYGANDAAGHRLLCDDARIYYEIYGTGKPLVLLHGGLYGYIDEFSGFIPELARRFQVIAIATRGHGRSELGRQPLTYERFARDALAVLDHVTQEKACVIGFSDGAITTYAMALQRPERIERIIAIGGGSGTLGMAERPAKIVEETRAMSGEGLARAMPQFVEERKKLMPQPELWPAFVEKMKALYLSPVYVDREKLRSVSVPFLLVQGEHDPYTSIESFAGHYRLFRNAQIAIVPGCGHLVLMERPDLARELIRGFLAAP
jgi:pimeloyl-ACP methyl ester carboxylesterase